MKNRLIYTIITLICTMLWNFNAYSADIINFSNEDYFKNLFPLFPAHGYMYNNHYSYTNNIFNSNSNVFAQSENPFFLEQGISEGFFIDDGKNETFKFYLTNNQTSNGDHIHRSPTYRAVRTSIEILSFCSVGIINYFAMKYTNKDDWQYDYSWYSVKHKFRDGWYWDPNDFNTNTVYHLYAGATYYMIGRSNGYSILESFGWSVFGSTMWEYFGEWREQVSLNDMIFTPTLGALTGEFFVQSANYVERKMKPGFLRSTIVFILYPFGTINRALDSSNSGDMRVRLIFANPLQTAVERKIEKDLFNR